MKKLTKEQSEEIADELEEAIYLLAKARKIIEDLKKKYDIKIEVNNGKTNKVK